MEPVCYGFGAMLGVGGSYQLASNVSLLGEVHVGLPWLWVVNSYQKTDDSYEKDTDPDKFFDFAPYIRGVIGISFHSKNLNKN